MAKLGPDKISTTVVGNALGTSTRDIGRLCTHQAINKWSRWKPYKYPSVKGLTDNIIKSINFGMTPSTITLNNIPTSKELEENMFIWEQWSAPEGGEDEPFRLGDFRTYNSTPIEPINKLIVENSRGGSKPIIPNPNLTVIYDVHHKAELYLNLNSDIKLNEFNYQGISSNNLYLTLVIGANINGYDGGSFIYKQSDLSLGEAYSQRLSIYYVLLDTADLEEVLNGLEKNIVSVYLAPKALTPENLLSNYGMSLKIKENIETSFYFDNYAVYGDGQDGGEIIKQPAVGTWMWLQNPYASTDGKMYFGFLKIDISQVRWGTARLEMYILELDKTFVILDEDISLSTNTQIIDVGLQNPFDLESNLLDQYNQLYSQLTCSFNLYANSLDVSAQFDTIQLNVPII